MQISDFKNVKIILCGFQKIPSGQYQWNIHTKFESLSKGIQTSNMRNVQITSKKLLTQPAVMKYKHEKFGQILLGPLNNKWSKFTKPKPKPRVKNQGFRI